MSLWLSESLLRDQEFTNVAKDVPSSLFVSFWFTVGVVSMGYVFRRVSDLHTILTLQLCCVNSSAWTNRRYFDPKANLILTVKKISVRIKVAFRTVSSTVSAKVSIFPSVSSRRHLSKSWTFALISLFGEKVTILKTVNTKLTTAVYFALRTASPTKTSWSKSINWLRSLLFCFIFPRWNRICFDKWLILIV